VIPVTVHDAYRDERQTIVIRVQEGRR